MTFAPNVRKKWATAHSLEMSDLTLISCLAASWADSVPSLQNAVNAAEAVLKILPNREKSAVPTAMKFSMKNSSPPYREFTEGLLIQESLHTRQVLKLKSETNLQNSNQSWNVPSKHRNLKKLPKSGTSSTASM